MCGIAGFLGAGTSAHLAGMLKALSHRGPDAQGEWEGKASGGAPIHLGHRRLSIIDISRGAQPMFTPCGQLGIIFNGEIYNHAALRHELEALGHRFQTHHSDTEVLLHAYRQWGVGMLNKLNGMWAFALVDMHANELLLSRDRFGKKPLFYSALPHGFAFASELPALRQHPGVASARTHTEALMKYFAYGYIPAPLTHLKGVHALPGGCYLKLSLNICTQSVQLKLPKPKRYWNFELEAANTTEGSKPSKYQEAQWEGELMEALEGAVATRMVADVPVGVLLSGGVDSSCIAALAAKHCVGNQRLRSFSIGFKEASFDESAYANLMVQHLGTGAIKHTAQQFTVNAARTSAPAVARHLGEPMGDSSILPTHLVCQLASQHVKVALTGDGADELLAGYDPFIALKPAAIYRRLNALSGGLMNPAVQGLVRLLPVSHQNISLDFKLKRFLNAFNAPEGATLASWMGPLQHSEIEALFGQRISVEELYSEAIALWDANPKENLINRALQFYTQLYMQNGILTKTDRASMAHGLELRSPFLDINVVNCIRRMPACMKLRGRMRKYILKQALQRNGAVPNEILYRAKKGFGVPVGPWFASGALKVNAAHIAHNFPLNAAFINAQQNQHQQKLKDNRLFLWCAYVLGKLQ